MSDIKEEITDAVETALDYPNKKIFDYIFENYGTTDEIKKLIYVKQLMPLDNKLRFYLIVDAATKKLCVLDAKNNKCISARYEHHQILFDVGNVPYIISKDRINELKRTIADKFALPKIYVSNIKNNITSEKFRKVKKDIENICGFEIYVK